MTDKGKQMECLFAWAEFSSNSKNVEVASVPKNLKFNQLQRDINNLRTELID